MKNKSIKFFTVLSFTMIIALNSCLNVDDEVTYTKEQEELTLRELIEKMKDKDVDVKETGTGLYYVIFEEGDSTSTYYAQLGDTLEVSYYAYFTNGYLFDSSKNISTPNGNDRWEFVLQDDKMIEGWIEGMQLMKEKSKMRFIIPSELAYGDNGNGAVPPYQTLIFDVEMHNIKPKI